MVNDGHEGKACYRGLWMECHSPHFMTYLEWDFRTWAFVQHVKKLTTQTEMSSGTVMAVRGGFIAVAYNT